MINVSRYLIVFIMLFVSSCNNILSLEQIKLPSLEQLGLSKTEKFQYLSGLPVNMYIDESNNGVILINNKIYKIKDLNITNEEIELKDNNKNFPIINILYSVDKDGNGILIYSRDNNLERQFGVTILTYFFYSINIENNKFKIDSNKSIFEQMTYNKSITEIILFSKGNYIVSYSNSDFYNKTTSIKIKKISHSKLEDYLFDKNIDSRTKTYSLNLDENGNGLYLSNGILNFQIFSVNNFTKGEEKLNIQFMNTNNNIYTNLLQSSSDNDGNGYILFEKGEYNRDLQNRMWNIYVNKFNNFKPVSDKELIFSSIDLNSIQREKYPIHTDKKGNGIIFMIKRELPSNKELSPEKMNYLYLYIKKIKDLKVEDKEIKLLDSNKYFYHDFKINEKGNGLVILKKNDSEKNIFIAKKIRNFEPEN